MRCSNGPGVPGLVSLALKASAKRPQLVLQLLFGHFVSSVHHHVILAGHPPHRAPLITSPFGLIGGPDAYWLEEATTWVAKHTTNTRRTALYRKSGSAAIRRAAGQQRVEQNTAANGVQETTGNRREGRQTVRPKTEATINAEGVTADRGDRTVCWGSDGEIPIGRPGTGSPVLWPCAAV